MSLDIDQIALHQLIKRDEQNLELVLRESLLEPNATVVEMMAELHRVYSAKSKAYGLFNEESELAQALRLQRQGKKSFWRSAARRLVVCAMNWRNTRSPKGALSSSASIVTWRSSICWWRCSIT
jgi:nucleoid-associated protein YejK